MFDTKTFKKSILNESVQGKLTKQLPEDGDANDLLQLIKKEKQRLIRAGKIKKQKKLFPIGDDERSFKIPDNWQWVRITEISSFPNQYSINPSDISPSVWVLDLKEIEENTGKILSKEYNYNKRVKSSKKIFKKNDVLFNKLRPYLNKVLVAPESGVATSELFVIHLLGGINSKYIAHVLQSPNILNKINEDTYGTKMPRAGTKQFSHCLLPLPPLSEQKRIVQKIDKCFKWASLINQEQKLTQEFDDDMYKSLLQSAMQGRLTQQLPQDGDASDLLQSIAKEKEELIKAGKIKKQKKLSPVRDDEIPFDIPNNWQWVRLGNISLISSSSRVHQSDWKNAGIPFYRAREVVKLSQNKPIKNPIYIDEKTYNEKVTKSGKPQPNDILFTGVGTLGTSWIVDNRKFYFKDASVLLLNNLYNMNPSYLNYFFKSPMFNQQVKKNSKGTAVKTLTITNSSNLIIPLPPLAEQKRIVDKLDTMFEHINNL